MAKTIEEIILGVLTDDVGISTKLSVDDRKCLAHTVARILESVEKHELELKRKVASEEISAKLKIAEEICTWQDKLKEIPFYKFSVRREIKFKILELQSELLYHYGGCCGKSGEVHTEDVIKKLDGLR
jgi:hypothetical protein